jgi:hypothetical protein
MANILVSNNKVVTYNGKPLIRLVTLANVRGLKAWHAARLIASPPADNTAVATFSDYSNNSNSMTQATGGNQPLFRTGIINGLPAFQFVSTDSVAYAASTTNAKAGTTQYMVYKRTSGTGAAQSLFWFPNAAAGLKFSVDINAGAAFDEIRLRIRRASESLVSVSATHQDTLFHVVCAIADYTNNIGYLYLDGVLRASVAIGGTSGAVSDAGAAGKIGVESTSTSPFTGYMAEDLFCDVAHTSKEVADISSTLMRIYGGLPQ